MWDRLQHALLDRLGRQNGIDVSRASLDSASTAGKPLRSSRPVLSSPIVPTMIAKPGIFEKRFRQSATASP